MYFEKWLWCFFLQLTDCLGIGEEEDRLSKYPLSIIIVYFFKGWVQYLSKFYKEVTT